MRGLNIDIVLQLHWIIPISVCYIWSGVMYCCDYGGNWVNLEDRWGVLTWILLFRNYTRLSELVCVTFGVESCNVVTILVRM
jgi:hypothetical protein